MRGFKLVASVTLATCGGARALESDTVPSPYDTPAELVASIGVASVACTRPWPDCGGFECRSGVCVGPTLSESCSPEHGCLEGTRSSASVCEPTPPLPPDTYCWDGP